MKKILLIILSLSCLLAQGQTSTEWATIQGWSVQDVLVTGQTAQSTAGNNIMLATAGTGSVDCHPASTVSYRSFAIQIIGTAGISAGAVTFEASNDNTTFVILPVYETAVVTGASLTTAAVTIAASTNRYFIGNTNYRFVRCRISTGFTGGTVQAVTRFMAYPYVPPFQVIMQATAANLNITPASTPLPTGFLASGAAADATANPTTSGLRDFMQAFNSSTWDRVYNNFNTTTGDAGAKTTSFAGATQTNFNARGAYIILNIGTVTGTTPTLSAQLQWSFDGGTTWLNLGPGTANITASGTQAICIYPSNWSSTAGATPANLTTGASVSTLFLNGPLPRTWRLNYTIGGTTPSFTFTSVPVNYIQ